VSKCGLILAAGNPARQDDGLGPAAAEALQDLAGVQVDCGFQYNIEDCEAISRAAWVVFVDALASEGDQPWEFEPVEQVQSPGYTSHAVHPSELIALTEEVFGMRIPAWTMGIRGRSFEMFEEGLTPEGQIHLDAAVQWLRDWTSRKQEGITPEPTTT